MGLKWCGGFFKGIAAQLCRKRLAKGKPTEINLKDPFVEKILNQLSSFQWFLKSVSCKLWCRKNTDRKKCILSSVSPAAPSLRRMVLPSSVSLLLIPKILRIKGSLFSPTDTPEHYFHPRIIRSIPNKLFC